MEKLDVENAIIGKQFETSANYERLLNIAKKKNVNIYEVEAGKKIRLDSEVYLDILWPSASNKVNENVLNNNSLVCKFVYGNFSVLFAGDIEEKAERAILQKYKDNMAVLNAIVLKVAHHGSKTSSSKKFLEAVKPKIALIGVGERNTFGHPADITLESLKSIGCKIYRTDENGEINIRINGKGEIVINKMLN